MSPSATPAPAAPGQGHYELLLREYDALRAEINLTMHSRNTILTYGFAALGALMAVVFLAERQPDRFLTLAVLSFGVPALSTLILALWLAEFVRMARAGAHVARIEARLNSLVGDEVDGEPPLTWEHRRWLDDSVRAPGRPRHAFPLGARAFIDAYVPIQCWFLSVAVAVPPLGVLEAGLSFHGYWWAWMPWFVLPALYLLWGFNHHYQSVASAAREQPAERGPAGRRPRTSPAAEPAFERRAG